MSFQAQANFILALSAYIIDISVKHWSSLFVCSIDRLFEWVDFFDSLSLFTLMDWLKFETLSHWRAYMHVFQPNSLLSSAVLLYWTTPPVFTIKEAWTMVQAVGSRWNGSYQARAESLLNTQVTMRSRYVMKGEYLKTLCFLLEGICINIIFLSSSI